MISIKRIFIPLFIALTFLVQAGYAQLTNTSKRTIVVMGSSSAYGWKSSVQDSAWVYRLQKDLHFYGRGDTVIDIAFPGNTTFDCLPTGAPYAADGYPSNPSYNVTKALSYNPTFVIISLPTNDVRNGYANSEVLANYTTITNALTAAGVPFILTGTQPRNLATDAGCSTAFDGASVCLSSGGLSPAQQANLGTFNGLLAAQYPLNATYNTPIVNNFLTLLSVSSTNFEIAPAIGYGDGIHYTDEGHRIVYNTFLNFQLYKDLVCFTQSINFSLSAKALGTPDFDPGATATSGLTVTYASSNPTVATIVAGKIHIVGVGSATITASQSGNNRYLAAPDATQTLTVTSATTAVYDWTGAVSSDWANAGNWQVSGSAATDYPGDAQSTDQVNIGVNNDYTNAPVVSATLPNLIASLTFGDRLITGASTTTNTLTINSGATLTVTGQLLQKHTTAGVLNSGNTSMVNAIQTYIQGGGTVNCGSLAVGDNTAPMADGVVNITKVILGAAAGGSTITMNITGDLSINTQSRDDAGNTQVLSNSDAQFSLTQGTLTIGGQIKLTDAGANSFTGLFEPASIFSIDLFNNSDSPVLNLQNAQALNCQSGNVGNKFDFYNVVQAGGSGTSTVNYTGTTDQEVYNNVSGSTVDNYVDNDPLDDFVVYQNLGFSGSGTKIMHADSPTGTLIVSGNFTLAPGTEVVDFATNNCALLVGGNYTTGSGSTFNAGTRPIFISASFNNAGTSNFGTAAVTFNSGAEEMLTTVGPQLFTNLAFAGGGIYDMNAGSFHISSQGVLTMSNFSQLNANGKLTLNSDADGSATVAAIPSDCAINGVVDVQRYVNAYRSYRLVSSPVTDTTSAGDAATDTHGNKVYSINYLLNNTYLTGTAGTPGGFDKAGNPTLYLFRENLVPSNSTFTSGNFRGIGYISNSPSYTIDNDGQNYSIPVGNGYLFYFRGSRNQKTLTELTTAGAAATDDTLNAKGLLNQGTITVSHWYTGTPELLYSVTSGNAAIEGFNLVGNPYASSIDWDTFSDSTATAPIYGPGLSPIIALMNPTGQTSSGNYGYYAPGVGGTNNATNIIPSGVGFFVQATPGGTNTLTFTEAAKTNTQPAAISLFMAKKPPVGNTKQSIRLLMSADSVNTDETLINFSFNTKPQYDLKEDARYRNGTGKVSLASMSGDQVPLGINQMPWSKNRTIPLKVSATASGNYNLTLKSIQGIPQLYTVALKDAYTRDSVDLRKAATYSFAINTADTATFGASRFSLVISEDPAKQCELLSFDAQRTGIVPQVQLQWKTKNEADYTRFTVERSTDNGKTFNVLTGFTSTDAGNYSYLDNNPSYGTNLYRLKQVDIDNNVTYSQTQKVDIINRDNRVVCVYPNPAKSSINLCIVTKTRDVDRYNILVTNSSGVIVRQVLSSRADWQSNISSLLTGTYLVRVLNSKDRSLVGEAKFVKL